MELNNGELTKTNKVGLNKRLEIWQSIMDGNDSALKSWWY